jgi:hypothetical protein
MEEIEEMIREAREWRKFHREQRLNGVRGAGIEAMLSAIREKALCDARDAILRERAGG